MDPVSQEQYSQVSEIPSPLQSHKSKKSGFIITGAITLGFIIWAAMFATFWRTIAPAEGHFSIQMPESPTKGIKSMSFSTASKLGSMRFVFYEARPFRQIYVVGYHELDSRAIKKSSRYLLRKIIDQSHVVRGLEWIDMDYENLNHELPAIESVFLGEACLGATYDFTKRVYISREHKRAFVVIHGVHTREAMKPGVIDARDRFLESFEVDEAE